MTPAAVTQIVKAVQPVAVASGWTPGTYALYAILLLMLPLVVAMLKYLPTMRRLKDSADASLRTDLMAEIAKLRDEQREERKECDRRLDGYQRKMDAITRKFFQFQLSLVRYLPPDAAPVAQQSVDHILEIIERPIESFMTEDSNGGA